MQTLAGKIATSRLRLFMDTPQSGGVLAIAGIELRAQAGGSNLATTPGSAACASTGSGPGLAVDGNGATLFTANTSAVWWEYSLAALSVIEEVTLVAGGSGDFNKMPREVSVAFLDSNGRWPIVASATGLAWTAAARQAIAIDTAWGPARFFRQAVHTILNLD